MHSDASNDSAQSLYRAIGAYYDAMTRVQDYTRWARLYRDLLEKHGVPGRRLLDVGCGTGRAVLELARLGFTVTRVDLSPEMIGAARQRTAPTRWSFVTADARSLPALGTFDAVVTMGEPRTYLPGEEELARVFPGTRRSLRAGGLFLSDLPTVGFQDGAAARPIDETDAMVVLTRGRSADPAEHTTELTVDLFTATGGRTRGPASRSGPGFTGSCRSG
ncbi:class I SAM-dependent methyltransferase [Streptomyces sp. enrichment culture]|uniref:class I SAM-dependent methyltransferase n=1 Tax=Streptomyces sp. enrichment culture TaxID=1795815 RepID=UPI003F55795F